MRRASLITIFSGFTTRRTDDTDSSVRIIFTSSRLRWSRSTASKTASPAIGSVVILETIGRTAFTTLRSTGKIRSMYQFMTSGRRQQPERLGGRRAVDHEHVVVPRSDVGLHVDQREDLVEARDHRELLGLDRLGAGPVHQLDEVVLDLAPVVLEPLLRVDLLRPQVLGDQRRLRIDLDLEGIAERVRRVGRHHERALPLPGGAHGRRRGHGGLADAALTGEQDDSHEPQSTAPAGNGVPATRGEVVTEVCAEGVSPSRRDASASRARSRSHAGRPPNGGTPGRARPARPRADRSPSSCCRRAR